MADITRDMGKGDVFHVEECFLRIVCVEPRLFMFDREFGNSLYGLTASKALMKTKTFGKVEQECFAEFRASCSKWHTENFCFACVVVHENL